MRKTVGIFLFVFLLAVLLMNTRRPPNDGNDAPDGSASGSLPHESDRVVEELKTLLRAPVHDNSAITGTVADYSAKYDFSDDEIATLAHEYGNTAINIAKEQGRQGGVVLRSLGQQGVAIMRERDEDFEKIAKRFGGETAAAFLIAYNDDFAEIARQNGAPKLLDRIEQLQPASKRLAEKKPEMFPFLLAAETEVREAWEINPDTCLTCFSTLALNKGTDGVREVADKIVRCGRRAEPWIQSRGLDGLLLADTFPEILELSVQNNHNTPVVLPVFLQILSNNQDDLRILFARGTVTADEVWRMMKKIQDVDNDLPLPPDDFDSLAENDPQRLHPYRGNFLELASNDPHLLRLLLNKGDAAIDLIVKQWERGGKFLPSLLYDAYDEGKEDDTALFDHAWDALTLCSQGMESHVLGMLLQMARFDGRDTDEPNSQHFRRLLCRLDHRVVLFLAESDAASPKFDALEERGLDELNVWTEPTSMAVEMIPLYDASRLVWVLSKGYVPRTGEVVFATVDVAFTTWDAVTLGGGTIASQAARAGIKTVGKKTAKELAEIGVKKAASGLTKKLSREAAEEVVETLVRRSFYSPKNLTSLFEGGLVKNVANNLQLAERSLTHSKKILVLGRNLTAEWGLGMTLGTGLEHGIKMIPAQTEDKRNGEVSLWGQKVKDYLIYLNDVIESPVY